MKLHFTLIILCLTISNLFSQPQSLYLTSVLNMNEHFMFTQQSDTTTGNWKYIDTLPQALYGVTSIYWSDSDKVFVCGGANSSGVVQSGFYFYDPSTNQYHSKAPLPSGRAFGKLVRVKDSLYLISSVGSSFVYPDGMTLKYDPASNTWIIKALQTSPYLHESAVVVWNDSLILTICGSTTGFSGSTNYVRAYNPSNNQWTTLTLNNFPIISTSSHAECIGNTIIVMGGYGAGFNNTIHIGSISGDTITTLVWDLIESSTPFGVGVYRVGGGQWGSYALFGPAMRNSTSYGQIWGFNVDDSTWRNFLPNTLDTAGNRPTLSVRPTNDSIYFYLFGGILNTSLSVTHNSERYAFESFVIGLKNINSEIPSSFQLYQNYPNPFNPTTKIRFSTPLNPPFVKGRTVLSTGGFITLKVYDILGREIASLVNESGGLKPGVYEVEFDASRLPTGIYFYRITVYESGLSSIIFTESKKMIYLK